jgi:hypothetical protein
MVAIMTNGWLPKLYAFSAMWTLNTRREIARSGGLRTITSPEWRRYYTDLADLDLGFRTGMTSLSRSGQAVGRPVEVHTVHRAERYDAEVFSPTTVHAKDKSEDSSTRRSLGDKQ